MSSRGLILAVIDGLRPDALERAVADGTAPVLARLMGEGVYVDDCVASFPSVTPVCAASITTGVGPDQHLIPSMNWYHREERRYVEYGSSFAAARKQRIARTLGDTVYAMNRDHLSPATPTIFESLDDAGLRTAGTTYLIYRGRHTHQPARHSRLARFATSTFFRESVQGPRDLFYADIFASRPMGCRSQLGMTGVRDQHSGCVGAELVATDEFDFLLLSLPDNDSHSHKHGPAAQVESVAVADRQLARLADAAGGVDQLLDRYGIIVAADHGHDHVSQRVDLLAAFSEWWVRTPRDSGVEAEEIALGLAQRSAMIYVLKSDSPEHTAERAAGDALRVPGVDLAMLLGDGEARVLRLGSELRFAPGGDLLDAHGRGWSVEGDLSVLGMKTEDGMIATPDYPDALRRIWSALNCPTAGDVLLSAAPGSEFLDWGGASHLNGGSHGSLHRVDSHGVLLWAGTGPDSRSAREEWSIRDVAGLVREHFNLDSEVPADS
ncbi:MAG: alkaline phosphatase family protein [Solirubrobacterales bacterium]|nr:alkaline phosphatase family protein [Solirubrobacterales bacterium]